MIGIVIITHGQLGAELVDTLSGMLGPLPLATRTLAVHRHDDPDVHVARASAQIRNLDSGEGVLILTDAFGSTPSNIAQAAAIGTPTTRTRVAAGINLPMLIHIYNYPQRPLEDTFAAALEAGRDGILDSFHADLG